MRVSTRLDATAFAVLCIVLPDCLRETGFIFCRFPRNTTRGCRVWCLVLCFQIVVKKPVLILWLLRFLVQHGLSVFRPPGIIRPPGNMTSRSGLHYERQEQGDMTCAVHTLNGLLQQASFSVVDLGEIAMDIESDETALLGGKKARNTNENVGMDGNFNVQVPLILPA